LVAARTRFSPTALRTLRKQARVSRDVLAFAIGRTTGSIANYEQGKTAPSAEIVAEIADYLDCELSDLFEEEVERV
jgi:transcriptional regulator with XRE-family HTH domain